MIWGLPARILFWSRKSFYEVLDLGFGKCRFALAVKQGTDFTVLIRPEESRPNIPMWRGVF